MNIRQIYTTPLDQLNRVGYHGSNVSMTMPDQTLSVKEIYERYLEGNKEVFDEFRNKQLVFDTDYDPDIDVDDYDEVYDANDAYERGHKLEEIRAAKEVQHVAPAPDPASDPVSSPDPAPAG